MVLHRNWPTLDTTRSLRPWLFGVAFRVVRTHRRRRAREAPHAELDPEDGSPTPEAWLQGQESLALLSAALRTCARVAAVRRRSSTTWKVSTSSRSRASSRITKFGVYAQALQGTQGAGLRRSAVAEGGVVEMKRRGSDLEPELEAFLTPRKIQRQMPPELRARVLARARAIAGGRRDPASARALRTAPPMRGARGRRLLRIALAASFAVAGAAVGAVAALHGRTAHTPADRLAGRVPSRRRALRSRASAAPSSEPPAPARRASRRPEPPHPARPGAKAIRSPPSSICFSALMPRTRGTTSRSR